MTADEFEAGFQYIRGVCQKEPINADTAPSWFGLVRHLPADIWARSCQLWAAEATYSGWPMPGEILKRAGELMHGLLPTHGEAWKTVLACVRAFGRDGAVEAVESLDPLTRKALAAVGGFVSVCNAEDISTKCAHFRMAYEPLAERETRLARLPENLRPMRTITSGNAVRRLRHSSESGTAIVAAVTQDLAAKLPTADVPQARPARIAYTHTAEAEAEQAVSRDRQREQLELRARRESATKASDGGKSARD